jgi:hypothetical protein
MTFGSVVTLFCVALVIGIVRTAPETARDDVPRIGRIQVLNGCGMAGVADKMADLLRKSRFDVLKIDNAQSFNYPFTMVVSRSKDMGIAEQVARALRTDHLVLVRTEDQTYDVTVIIGPDFKGQQL